MTKLKTLSVSVVSGKGGVGKTNLALNLGYALHKAGYSSILMDCDVGLANLDVLLGLAPEKTIQDLLESDSDASKVVVSIEDNGFHFIPSASGVSQLIDLDYDEQSMIFEKLDGLLRSYDFFIMDLGAGISRTVLSYATVSQERVIVITSEPTSLTDGYALIKVLFTEYGVTDFHVAANMVQDEQEGRRSFERLAAAAEKFLGIKLNYLGCVRSDPAVPQAVIKQVPLLKLSPKSKAASDILRLAVKLKGLRDGKLQKIADQPLLRKFPAK
jgi:flagellar biosynthesis protein FlhG